ncbi:class I SAM-dependent methyltransferase [Streptomyces armeniacus]|uniref:Class I SAM-dependent methyltransferase n=1 Tax=Streptomyces armeniacus TaxID=83291 RepID=A0A345XQC4_9ACTN|nr:class I SAM-dependent methyltransferase [Streptomyces armeniacus]AXK33840.1 class I SAM-dependent methyltransferase [Streptomyces armeniacus]
MGQGTDWTAVFDDGYTRQERRDTRRRIWRDVYGDEYPEQADPYSFTTRTELDRIAAETGVGDGELLVDLGCGRGGTGLTVASRASAAATGTAAGTSTGAGTGRGPGTGKGVRLLGLDISEVALREARAAVARFPGLDAAHVDFRRGEFADTGLPDGAARAVMSVDALTFAPDKQRALDEIHRVLAPGGRAVFTSWDYHRTPEDRPPQVPDHRPLLERAGFHVRAYEETPDWRRRMRAVSHGLIDRRDELAEEEGEEAADAVAASVRHQLDHQIPLMSRRVLAVAERRS